MRNDDKLKKGDTIQCRDKEDLLNTALELDRLHIKNDFLYEKDGQKGYWIEVLETEE